MDTNALIALILKALNRHERTLELFPRLASVGLDLTRLVEPMLEKCARVGCNDAATVKHATLGVKHCDHCAAVVIVKARQNLGEPDGFDEFRWSIMNEDNWVDVPNAEAIRRMREHLDIAGRDEEPDAPEDRQLLQ
jgi:hypothetical protein